MAATVPAPVGRALPQGDAGGTVTGMHPPLTAQTRPESDVVVYAPRSKRSPWHTDPGCPHVPAGDTVTYETEASYVAQWLLRMNRFPCRSCALVPALAVSLRATADTQRVVLVCPARHSSGAARGCLHCATLRAAAELVGEPVVDVGDRVALRANVDRDDLLPGAVALLYPAEEKLSNDAIALAWRIANPDPTAHPVLGGRLGGRVLRPVTELRFDIAAVVTA